MDAVESILEKCDGFREDVKLLKRQADTIEESVDEYEQDLEDKSAEKLLCEKSSLLFKKIADDRNKSAKEQIEKVMNYALSNVPLEQNYKATLEEKESKRSGKEMRIVLTDIDTGYERDLKDQTGTWIVQIISFILTMIILKFNESSRVMILDEVFTGMEDYEMIKIFGDILVSLSENEDFQLFMVEHRSELDRVEDIKSIPLRIEDYNEGTKVVSQ